MDIKKTLVNLKGKTLYVLLPLVLVACESRQDKINAELADINARLDSLVTKVDSAKTVVATEVADSVARNQSLLALSQNIAKYQDAYNKASAPRDSVKRKKINKYMNKLRGDSILLSNNVAENLTRKKNEQFADLFSEYETLLARRRALLKERQK